MSWGAGEAGAAAVGALVAMAATSVEEDVLTVLIGLGGVAAFVCGGRACVSACASCGSGGGSGYVVVLTSVPANPPRALAASLQAALELPSRPALAPRADDPSTVAVTVATAAERASVADAAARGSLRLNGVTVGLG